MTFARALLAMLLAVAVAALAAAALAHQAPSGWAYDRECCSDHDCAPVPETAVAEVVGGYSVRLVPGDHPMVMAPLAAFLAHGSPMLRVSGDGRKHVCVHAGRVLCVYLPPGGV